MCKKKWRRKIRGDRRLSRRGAAVRASPATAWSRTRLTHANLVTNGPAGARPPITIARLVPVICGCAGRLAVSRHRPKPQCTLINTKTPMLQHLLRFPHAEPAAPCPLHALVRGALRPARRAVLASPCAHPMPWPSGARARRPRAIETVSAGDRLPYLCQGGQRPRRRLGIGGAVCAPRCLVSERVESHTELDGCRQSKRAGP